MPRIGRGLLWNPIWLVSVNGFPFVCKSYPIRIRIASILTQSGFKLLYSFYRVERPAISTAMDFFNSNNVKRIPTEILQAEYGVPVCGLNATTFNPCVIALLLPL